MNDHAKLSKAIDPMSKPQSLSARLFFFLIGGGISVALNAGPFHWMRTTGGLPDWMAYGISLTFVTVLFSVWNYFINFKTQRGWRECLVRYLAAVGACAALNYSVVLPALKFWEHAWLPIIAAVQVAMGGVKFLLYHYWVYPHGPAPVPETPSRTVLT